MLEPDEGDVPASEASEAAREQAVKDDDTRRDTQDSAEAEVTSNSETMPDELPVDTNWEDTYDMGATSYSAPADSDGRDFFETHSAEGQSLHEHLSWQLDLSPFSDEDRAIAEAIIDSISDDGYLTVSLEEMLESLDLPPEREIGIEEMQVVLRRIQHFELDKQFHVSPFMGMDIHYRWSFTRPGERLIAHLQNQQDGGKLFDASLMIERRPISSAALAAALLRYPFMTLKVVAAIYYQALRLWLKKTPFHPHPGKKEAPHAVKT
jgi:hypothetical protein